jgi:hypothetical protein
LGVAARPVDDAVEPLRPGRVGAKEALDPLRPVRVVGVDAGVGFPCFACDFAADGEEEGVPSDAIPRTGTLEREADGDADGVLVDDEFAAAVDLRAGIALCFEVTGDFFAISLAVFALASELAVWLWGGERADARREGGSVAPPDLFVDN